MRKNLNVKQAAEHVGLSVSQMNKMRCFGGGPGFMKLGRAIRYSVEDLNAWMEARKRVSTWNVSRPSAG